MAQTSGWQALKDYIESLIGHLQAMEGVDASSTVEQVGFKYLATSVACAYLQAVIDRVEAVKKFFDEEEVKKNALRHPEEKRRRIRP